MTPSTTSLSEADLGAKPCIVPIGLTGLPYNCTVADVTCAKPDAGIPVVLSTPTCASAWHLASRRTWTSLISGRSGSTADSRLTRPAVNGNRMGHGPYMLLRMPACAGAGGINDTAFRHAQAPRRTNDPATVTEHRTLQCKARVRILTHVQTMSCAQSLSLFAQAASA